jgi:YVTN family beta-propeller protein
MKLATILLTILLLLATVAYADSDAMRGFLYVPCYSSNDVYKISTYTSEVVAIIPVGAGPAGIAVGPTTVYVTCRFSSRLYCISQSDDVVSDSLELSPNLAFGIGVALDSDNNIFVVGRESSDAYAMDGAGIVKLNSDGDVLDAIKIDSIQADCLWAEWNQMGVIGLAIRDPKIIIPWSRSWDVHTGITITNTDLDFFSFNSFDPRQYGYRGPGAAFDTQGRGWSTGMREEINYLIGYDSQGQWQFNNVGYWNSGAEVFGDVAVDREGHVWSGNAIGNLIKFFPENNSSHPYYIGYQQIKGIAIDRQGYIWVALYPLNVVRKFDTNGHQIGADVPVGEVPLGYGDMTGYEFGRQTAIDDDYAFLPEAISLDAYPNPFNSAANFVCTLNKPGFAEITVYNLIGQKIETLYSGFCDAGEYRITWNARQESSGIYFVRLESGGISSSIKITLAR